MDTKKRISLDFDLKFDELKDINKSFAIGKCAIAYAGRNRNRSTISRETFEAALPSIKNIPVVCNYNVEKNSIGSHDISLAKNANGELIIINETSPIGVVYESAEQYWQEIDGVDYLYTDILLWKRQPAYQYFVQNSKSAQSMEIEVQDYYTDDEGYFVIKAFQFEALCALGEGIEPCFEAASIQIGADKTFTDYKLQFSQMVADLKELASQEPAFAGFSYIADDKEKVGENELANEKTFEEDVVVQTDPVGDNAVVEVVLDEDVIGADETKLDEMAKCDDGEEDKKKFSSTYEQKREAIQNALDPIVVRDDDGLIVSETYFWLQDFDEKYAYVEKSLYTDGDRQWENGRMGYTYDDAEKKASITSAFEKMVVQWLTIEEAKKLDESRNIFIEVEDLRKYKRDIEIAQVFAQFEDLNDNEQFVALKEDNAQFSIQELTRECLVIRGMLAVPSTSQVAMEKTPKLPIKNNIDRSNSEPYNGIFTKFGIHKNKDNMEEI